MRASKLTSFTAGAICMLVLGSGTAVAATGGKFILGHSNSATATTTLTNTKGTALSLKAPSNKAPLAVSGGTKVTNLNADKIDGLDSASLARTAGATGTVWTEGHALDTDNNGLTDIIEADSYCPSGTIATGGGYWDGTSTGYVIQAGTNDNATPNEYGVVLGVSEGHSEYGNNLRVQVICYNPKGAFVPDPFAKQHAASRTSMFSRMSPAERRVIAAKVAAHN